MTPIGAICLQPSNKKHMFRDIFEETDLLEEPDHSFRISEDEALDLVAAAVSTPAGEQTSVAGTVEICNIAGFSIRLTNNNNIFVKLPRRGRRYVYGFQTHVKRWSTTTGRCVHFDREFDLHMPTEVVDRLIALLDKQAEVHEREEAEELAEPPIDLVEENWEETPATVGFLD